MVHRIKIHYLLFLFFLCTYLITASGTVQSSDGTSMFLVIRGIVENKTFSIQTDRTDLAKRSKINGNYYSKYGIGQSVLVIPLFVAGKIMSPFLDVPAEFLTKSMVSLYNSLITSATCLMIYLFCRKLGYELKTTIIISFLYGFSTIAWHYSQTFMSEPTTTLFILSAVYFIFNYKMYSKRNLYISGLFIGLAILTRIASIVVIPCILFYIYCLWRHQQEKDCSYKNLLYDAALFLFPILVAAILFFYYNYTRFGNILDTGYREGFSTNFFMGIYGLLFSTGKGLFIHNPILILSIIGFYHFYKDKKSDAILFLLIILSHLLLYAKWSSWHAGMSWGGRFLLVIIPYFLIALEIYFRIKKYFVKKGFNFFCCCRNTDSISIPGYQYFKTVLRLKR